MCLLSSESDEHMEPNDNELLGHTREDHVGSSSSSAVNPEQRTVQNDASSSQEAPLPSPLKSLKSCESFASSFSDYSVDVTSYVDGRSREDNGGSENGQDDPRYRLYSALVPSLSPKETQEQGENGNLDLHGYVENNNGDTSSDESSVEASDPSPTFYERDDIWDPPEPEHKKDDEPNSMTILDDDDDDDDDDDESANADISEWAMPRSKEKKMESRKVKVGKFKDLVSQLLRKLDVEISEVNGENWTDIVTDLAWKAAKFLKPGAHDGKVMDPSGYVKIKCVATGTCSESRLIKGLVFKKHAAHKHMITKYKNPKLLLVQGMLGPSSGSSGLSSFSSMITENQVNCDDLIQNLQACQPNVILVEKSASRAVMEKILQLGVTLVLDMKYDRLERVARCTGSPIFSSDTAFNQKLTHCESLYFEKIVEEHAIVGEGGKKPSKTLMFLEGCPTNFGCTILLKGSHGEELKKIKCIVQCAVVMAYHFLLETSFLVDQKAMFSTITIENASDMSSTAEQSTSAVSESSSVLHGREPDVGNPLADGGQVLISSGDDQESSNENDVPIAHDIAVSNGLEEKKICRSKELTAKEAETTSVNVIDDNSSYIMQSAVDTPSTLRGEPHMTTLSSASRSLSQALEKVSIVSPDTYKNMSTYMDLNGKKPESQTAVSISVSSVDEPAEDCDTEAKIKDKEDESLCNDTQSASTSSVVDGEEKGSSEDGKESIRAKDEVNSVLDSESILVLMSSRNVSKGTICEQSHFTHIKFYRNFDVPLGKFLRDNLFNQALKCVECGELPEAHYYYYAHHSKQLTIRVKRLGKSHLPRESEGKLWMWSRCSKCEPEMGKATKRVLISTAARCLSFGKFLELSFSSQSTFNRLSSCGHSFQKDFLYFFGFGSMVAMFQYSRVAIYTISVPAHKLEFSSSMKNEWLEPEVRTVYTTGLVLFNELEKYLKKIEPQFSGWSLILNGFSKGFSDIFDLLKLERSEFEEKFNKKNEDSHDSVYKLLSLNRLRWEILLEACVWDRRLQSLLSSSSISPQSSETGHMAQKDVGFWECENPEEEAKWTQTVAKTVKRDGLLDEHKTGSEIDGTQKISDKAIIEQMDSEKEQSDGTVEATAKVLERQTESNNEKTGDNNVHGYDRTSENCNGVGVQIEMVAEAEKFSAKESLHDGILQEKREQDLVNLPIVEEDIQRSPSLESIPSVSLSQDLNESASINNDKVNSSSPADDELSERPSSPRLLQLDSSLWNSFEQIREECMGDLVDGRPPRFGHLPKFGLFHSPDFLPTVSQVIADEGLRLHMPLRDGDFIVSDFDGEISSYIACALARTETSSYPSSENDENVTLKRAASEPWPLSGVHDPDLIHSSSSMTFTDSHLPNFDGINRTEYVVSNGRLYKEVNIGFEKSPAKGKHSVVIIHPNEFRSLRQRCCPSELDYIASLSRCKIWDAKGGKSKSVFAKTLDERLIIKEIKKTEFDSFMKFASDYFQHMTVSVDSGNQTCLAKILGLYQVTIKPPNGGKETKHDLMVQENLSFGRNITRQYDLKGALRARFTETADGAGDVLLDQNFVKDMKSSPLYIGQKYKRLLQRAVWNDTTFLNNIGVMDYSLLVGVDRQRRDLVCGIIDYLRQYTWDKQFETWVKSSLAPKSDTPTIISPQEYKKRFRKFMDTRFLTVPDDWCFHRSSNPCKLCGTKVHGSSVAKLQKREEEHNCAQARD